MKNVLIPTDFTAGSLEFVGLVAKNIPVKLNVFLFHAFDMPGSLLEAMSRAGINTHGNMITEELRMKCKRLKASHQNINNISFRPMYGTTTTAFGNFASANAIDLIALPTDYKFSYASRDSVNPERMFRKSGIVIVSNFSETDTIPAPSAGQYRPADEPAPAFQPIIIKG